MMRHLIAGSCLAGALVGQRLEWQAPSAPFPHEIYEIAPFVDHDGDGHRDFLMYLILNSSSPNTMLAHRIVSGLDGSTLWERQDVVAANMVDAGDVDGDGVHDILMRRFSVSMVSVWSVGANQWLWQNQLFVPAYGEALLGDIDLTGDGRPDAVTTTIGTSASDVYAYGSTGQLLYSIPCWSQGLGAESLGKVGDMNGDGCEEFVVGCQDASARGVILLVSGSNGAILRTSHGQQPGDKIWSYASNFGDLDGDGVPEYGGFPSVTASRHMVTAFSGQTGAIVRMWPVFANSAVTGQDMDLDGVPDLVIGADYIVTGSVRGRTIALSGRDGGELWRVDNAVPAPGSGISTGSNGWMDSSVPIGVRPGQAYPSFAWLDTYYFAPGTAYGRVRSYNTARAGQDVITGMSCSTSTEQPMIGARQTPTGARFTIAKGPPGGLAWLCLSLASETSFGGMPLPIDMSMFGYPGCWLQVAPTATSLHVLGTQGIDRGFAASNQPFQLTAATTGVPVIAQWLALDPVTLGFAATRVHHILGQ